METAGLSSAPILRRLGFSPSDRVVVLHADDIGMCEATVSAYGDIVSRGLLSSASAMVPCGWIAGVGRSCRGSVAHDMGVHLTLTSEWVDYRWGPLLGCEARDLCDAMGYFHSQAGAVQDTRLRGLAHRELHAQILRAQNLGIDITHLDSHMFTVLHPTLFPVYVELAREFGVPCVILPHDLDALFNELDVSLREDLFVFDAWAELPLSTPAECLTPPSRLDTARRILDDLPCGLTYFISHPAIDSPELRAIAPDWRARVADYTLYMDDAWARAVEASNVEIVGMRRFRDLLRSTNRQPLLIKPQ
jgi:chitin disaccharide deacetylase